MTNKNELNELSTQNVFDKMYFNHRTFSARSDASDYKIHHISSIIMEEIDVNGCLFIARYDRRNEHKLTIIDMEKDGIYDLKSTEKTAIGTYATITTLDKVPEELRLDKHRREVKEIMRYFYKKYHHDIAKYI